MVLQASSYAASIDGLIMLILVLVGFWFILAEGMFFWLIWKFRARPGVIIIGAVRVWHDVKQQLPEADYTVRVIGQQWAWVFQHPGGDGELDTADDIYTTDDLYVQNGRTYHFQLTSRDVLHDFSIPVFRLKQDAVPGRTITGWFHPTQAGTYDIQCAEICGIGHGVMAGRITVQDDSEHAAWIAANSPASAQ
jgi:cytochrome c oxidase subunit 2